MKYFVAVAEELHFGRAARRLHISQPPLSQQIMKFEDELGVKLFARNKRSVELTAAGRMLLEDARRILDAVSQAEINLKAAASGHGGRLRVGYIGPALETPFADMVREYKNAYPDVDLSLKEMFTNDQLEAIRVGSIDIGVVRLFRHDVSDLEAFVFHRESYALIVPQGHRLEHKEIVDISELQGEPLIFSPREGQPLLYDEWMRVFNACGFAPDIVQEASTKTAAMALVAAGIGVSIVPESMGRRNMRGVVFKKMSGDYPSLEMHMLGKDLGNKLAANFVRIAQEVGVDD